jgi:7-cyano-7-deazaguanine synthase
MLFFSRGLLYKGETIGSHTSYWHNGMSPKTRNQKRKTAVVLASGGLDSCVTAAAARRDFDLALLHANYGQRTLRRELEAFRAQAAFYQAAFTLEIDLSYLGEIGGSSLTDFSRTVPTDEVEPPGIPSTYVPFRNTNFLAAAVAWAEVLGATGVFIGANVLDNPGYPDCRPEYFRNFERVIELGTRPETHLRIHTPLIDLDKAGIIRLGLRLGAPLELTWSCYQNDLRACGQCSSCRLRLKGFAAAGVRDPIPYA